MIIQHNLATAISLFSSSAKMAALRVFLFFLGMNISYHMYSIYVCGFNPQSYRMIWYTMTLISPILAALCWYAKKAGCTFKILRVLIFTVMMIFTFYAGWLYIDLGRIINLFLLTLSHWP